MTLKTFRAGIILFCTAVAGAVLCTALPQADKAPVSSPNTPITEALPVDLNIETFSPDDTDAVPSSSGSAEKDNIDTNIKDISEQGITEDELCLVAELVEAEAKGRSYMTRVCCAAVIFNRVADISFPSTIREVVYQLGAFRLTDTDKSEDRYSSRSFELAKAAVKEAALGRDPTGGALYFADADDKNTYVIPTFECGGMVFGK